MSATEISATDTRRSTLTGSLYYLFLFIATGSFAPFLYVYFSEMGLTGKEVGLIAVLSPLLMILAMPVATLADRYRARVRIIQMTLTGATVIVFLLQFPRSFLGIAVLMFFQAVFNAPNMSIADGLIARMSQRHKLNYGGMRLWGSMGYAFSALVFGVVWQAVGFSPMFVTSAVLMLPLIWMAGKLEEAPAKPAQQQKSMLNVFKDSGLVLLIVATFFSGIANSLAMTFSGIYIRSLGGGNFLVGLMIALGAFAELPAMFYAERISVRLRKSNTVILSYVCMVAAYLGYIYTANPNLIPFFSILKGIGYGLWFTTTVRLVTERTPDEWAATAQSLVTISMFGAAALVAGPLGGWLHDAVSPAAVFWLGIGALVLAIVVLGTASLQRKLD